MPRNAQGLYTLPAGNPVVSGTTIESTWANATMDDLAEAMTGSLPRNGSAPMTGQLTLNGAMPTNSRHAVSKAYVDQFVVYATGMPVGSVCAFGGPTAPAGWLKCDGQAVSRTTYAGLFALIGTIYGSGDGSTTFNLPNLVGEFVRGTPAGRAVGSKQAATLAAHTHAVQDPGHTHAVSASQAAHNHSVSTGAHTHSVNDPGHTHGGTVFQPGASVSGETAPFFDYGNVSPAVTGISVNAVGDLGGSTDSRAPVVSVSVGGNVTGIALGSTGGAENVPQNTAMDYYIKALQDTNNIQTVVALSSSDVNMISIDETNPSIPELTLHTNVAFGIPKLDANAKIPLSQLPQGASVLLGFFDASSGANPSQKYPTTDYSNGEAYIISVAGTILVRDPATNVESNVLVAVGGNLLYLEGQAQPNGWYYSIPVAATSASNISFLPEGTISATNVQAAIAELDSETQGQITNIEADIVALNTEKASVALAVPRDSATGAAQLPVGTTAQRPPGVEGQFRYNADLDVFEGFSNGAWGQVGGGQMYGQAATKAIFYNANTIGENLTVKAGQNGGTFGPVTINDGFTVTVEDGSVWSIV